MARRAPRLAAMLWFGGLAACEAQPSLPCDAPAAHNASAAAEAGVLPPGVQPSASIGRHGVRMDDGVVSLVHIEEVRAGRRPNGAGEVVVRMLNCSVVPLQIEGTTQFFDGSGGQAEPLTTWRRVFVPPRSSRDYVELSTTQRVASFFVDIRGGQ